MRTIPNRLIPEINLMIQRIRCGESFESTLKDRGNMKVHKSLAVEWRELCHKVRSGEWNSLDALTHFRNGIKAEYDCLMVFRRKSLTPLVEFAIISILLVAINIYVSIQLPTPTASMKHIIICALFTAASAMSLYFYKRYSKLLRRLGWLQLLNALSFHLHMGRSFPRSLQIALNSPDHNLEQALYEKIIEDANKLAQGKTETITIRSLQDFGVQIAYQWNAIVRQYQKGTPLLPTIDSFTMDNKDDLIDTMIREGEKLAFLMLTPVFLFLLPAFFISLVGPFWSMLSAIE